MDELERMLDQTGSSFEKALLQEGRTYQGPADLRARTLASLGLAGTAGLATGGILAWWSAKTWTTKILLVLSTVTLLGAVPTGYVMLRQGAPAKPVAKPAPLPALLPVETAPPAEVEPAEPSPDMATSAPQPAPAPARVLVKSSSALRAELAALDAVRSTLANDDATGALSFLDAYFRTYPGGRLRLEAEVLRIDALAKAGRMDTARRFAQEFLKRHPNSVLAARVRPYAERR
jgi:hypothetical protein